MQSPLPGFRGRRLNLEKWMSRGFLLGFSIPPKARVHQHGTKHPLLGIHTLPENSFALCQSKSIFHPVVGVFRRVSRAVTRQHTSFSSKRDPSTPKSSARRYERSIAAVPIAASLPRLSFPIIHNHTSSPHSLHISSTLASKDYSLLQYNLIASVVHKPPPHSLELPREKTKTLGKSVSGSSCPSVPKSIENISISLNSRAYSQLPAMPPQISALVSKLETGNITGAVEEILQNQNNMSFLRLTARAIRSMPAQYTHPILMPLAEAGCFPFFRQLVNFLNVPQMGNTAPSSSAEVRGPPPLRLVNIIPELSTLMSVLCKGVREGLLASSSISSFSALPLLATAYNDILACLPSLDPPIAIDLLHKNKSLRDLMKDRHYHSLFRAILVMPEPPIALLRLAKSLLSLPRPAITSFIDVLSTSDKFSPVFGGIVLTLDPNREHYHHIIPKAPLALPENVTVLQVDNSEALAQASAVLRDAHVIGIDQV